MKQSRAQTRRAVRDVSPEFFGWSWSLWEWRYRALASLSVIMSGLMWMWDDAPFLIKGMGRAAQHAIACVWREMRRMTSERKD